MLNELSNESKKSLNIMMIIWTTLLGSLFIYLLIAYMLLTELEYKAIYTLDILQTNVFMGINLYASIYIVSAILFLIGYYHFKKSYKKIVIDTNNKEFDNIDEEFKYFREKYLTNMFIELAIFDAIAILGIVVFLMTFDFNTLINLIIITTLGFILIMPSKNKFRYSKNIYK